MRLPTLDRHARAAFAVTALACLVAAVAFAPSRAQSQLGGSVADASPAPTRSPGAIVAIEPARDPFAPRIPADDDAPTPRPAPPASVLAQLPALPPLPRIGPLPPNAGAGSFPLGPLPSGVSSRRVSAVALGANPTALIVENGVAHIVGVGERLGTTRVTAIDATGVLFADGSRLVFAGDDTP